MIIKVNNTKIDNIEVFDIDSLKNKQLIIGIDSSKSNSAMSIGILKPYTREIEDAVVFEFNGERDGTTENDYFKLCLEQKYVLKRLLKDSYIRVVGIEDTITKVMGKKIPKRKFVNGHWITEYVDEDNQYTGVEIHKSRMATSIMFANFNMFFLENFYKECFLANVGAWKAATIPAEFRTRDKEKESHRYLKSLDPKFAICSDDYTDSICIMRYLTMLLKSIVNLPANIEPDSATEYSKVVCDISAIDEQACVRYDKNFDFDTNCRKAIAYTKTIFATPRVGLLCDPGDVPIELLENDYRLCMRKDCEKYVVICNEIGGTCYGN